MNNDLVRENEECLECVFLALQWFDRSTDCDILRPHPPRRALEKDVIVVTVCGRERPEFHTSFYLPSTEQWYLLPPISCEPKHVFSHRGKVFVATKDITESQCYDPDLNRWSPAPWTKLDLDLAFMQLDHTSLHIHDVLVIKDEICFIVGGRDSLTLWRYNVDLNSMTPLLDWIEKVRFCAVVVDQLIYTFGGVMPKDDTTALSHSSTFDTEGNEWKEIAPMNKARADACGVCKNGKMIFIAGGNTRRPNWLRSCEVYNIATNEWQFIANLMVLRFCEKMVLIDGTLYVLGDRIQNPFRPIGMVFVECYDEERNIWNDRTAMSISTISLGRMSKSRRLFSVLKICSLRLFKGVELNNLYPLQSDR